jgi:hypothetical protein
MTHAAIDACLKKLYMLKEKYQSIDALETEWLDSLSIDHVLQGSTHPGPSRSSGAYLYAGTVFQVSQFLTHDRPNSDTSYFYSSTTFPRSIRCMLTASLLMKLDKLVSAPQRWCYVP